MVREYSVQDIERGVLVWRIGVVLCLNEHRNLAPITRYAAWRVVRVPIIYAVAKLAGKVAHIVAQIQLFVGINAAIAGLRVGVLNRVDLIRLCSRLNIVRRVGSLVWILLGNKAQGIVCK